MSTRRLAAIMFCDIAGYTSMMQRDEQEGLLKANRYREVLQEMVEKHGGKIVQHYGDGSLSVFQSAVQSVRSALEIQQALQKSPMVPLRIGIHLGDIVLKGNDIYGDGVNVASRIENIGDAGAVLFSESIYNHIRNHPDLPAKFLGDFTLRNVDEPVGVYALTNEGLHVPAKQSLFNKLRNKIDGQKTDRRSLLKRLAPAVLVLLLAAIAIVQIIRENQEGRLDLPQVMPAGFIENFRGEEGDRIAVIPFENRTGNTSLDMIGVLAADWITQKLLETERAKIVSLSTVQQNLEYVGILPGNAGGRTSFAEATGATKIIEGSYYQQGDSLYLWAKISDAKTGELLYKMPVQSGVQGSPMGVVDQLSERIAGYWVTRDAVEKGKMQPPKMEAYQHWIEGRNAYGRDYAKSMREFDKAIEMDSNFIMPYIGKLTLTMNDPHAREKVLREIKRKEKEVNLTRYEKEFLSFVESDHPEESYRHIMKIHEMDPKSFMEKNIAADVALRTNRPQVALKIIDDVANPHFDPHNNFERNPVAIKAKALYQTGQYAEAIKFIEEVPFEHRNGSFHRIMVKSLVRTTPHAEVTAYIEDILRQNPDENARSYWFQIASAEYVLIDEAGQAAEMAGMAEKDLPPDARAYTYVLTGKHEEAEKTYEALIEQDPQNRIYVARLGALKAELGAQEEALKCVNQILEDIQNPGSDHYLSATIFAQMGDFEQAMEHLKVAYSSGYRFDDDSYGNDPLLDTMKSYQPFLDFIKPRQD